MKTNQNALTANLALATLSKNKAIEGMKNTRLIDATEKIFKSYEAIDKSQGALAYSMYLASKVFTDAKGKPVDGIKNFAEYAEKRIGVKKAQAYNLAKAGSLLKVIHTENGTVLVDKFTAKKAKLIDKDDVIYNDTDIEKITSFTNTALIRMNSFIEINSDGTITDDGKKTETIINQLIAKGKVTPDMSVALIIRTIETALKPVPADNDNDNNDNDNDNDNENDNGNENDNEKTIDTITLVYSKQSVEKIKHQFVKLISTFENVDKFNELYPALYDMYVDMCKESAE